jgi:ribose transport system substrate-binding protein
MSRLRALLVTVVVTFLAASLASCSNSTSVGSADCKRSVAVDAYKIPTCGPLRLAVFLPGTSNSYLQSLIAYLKSAIKDIPDASMTIFDGKFDTTTQVNQIQNALQSGKYNTAIAAPIDGVLTCDALTKQAPKAGLLVGSLVLPPCGLTANEGAALRAPGTLTYVGGTQSPGYWTDYLTWIAKSLDKPTKFLALTDPAAPFPLTKNFEIAMATVTKQYPNLDVVASSATDLTVADSYQKARAMLQAHPDATGVVTMYSSETQGAFQALKEAGVEKKFQIYDKGASVWAVSALKRGDIAAASPERPVVALKRLLDELVAARAGKTVLPFYGNDGADIPADAPASGFTVFTKDTVGSYEGEG